MKHIKYFEGKKKIEVSSRQTEIIELIEDILIEYTDRREFIAKVSKQTESSKTYEINITISQEIATDNGLGKIKRFYWGDDYQDDFSYNFILCRRYLNSIYDKIIKRLIRFGFSEYKYTLYDNSFRLLVVYRNKN